MAFLVLMSQNNWWIPKSLFSDLQGHVDAPHIHINWGFVDENFCLDCVRIARALFCNLHLCAGQSLNALGMVTTSSS